MGKVTVGVYYMEVNSVQESVNEVIDKTRAVNETRVCLSLYCFCGWASAPTYGNKKIGILVPSRPNTTKFILIMGLYKVRSFTEGYERQRFVWINNQDLPSLR